MFTLVTSRTPSTTVANTMQATLVKTGTQSAQDCAAVSLATPRGRKVLMNPLSKWLMPVALLALLLVEVGTAWGQDPTAPIAAKPALSGITGPANGGTITLPRGLADGIVGSQAVDMSATAKATPDPGLKIELYSGARAVGVPIDSIDGTLQSRVPAPTAYRGLLTHTFTPADEGKAFTYLITATNMINGKVQTAMESRTVTVKATPLGTLAPPVTPPVVTPPVVTPPVVTPPVVTPPVVTPPVVTPPVVTPPGGTSPGGTSPITGTNGTGRQKSARELYREGRTPGGALKAIIPTRATATDQSPANRTNPRMALRLGLGRGGGGNSTNAVTNAVTNGGALPAPIAPPLGN